jgi:Dna[CI] antecedent, DciA
VIPETRAARTGGVTSLHDALGAFLRSTGLAARLRNARVFEAWADALGPDLSRRAAAVRYHKGDLTVEVASAAHLHELRNFTGEGFRRDANARLGEAGSQETIRRVAFKLKR